MPILPVARIEKLLLSFLATAMHELGNPLAVVSGVTSLIRQRLDGLAGAERLKERDRLDLIEVVRAAVEPHHLGNQHHRYIMEVAAPAPLIIRGKRDRLGELMHNLLHNAAKYSPAGSEIHVRVGCRGCWAGRSGVHLLGSAPAGAA